MFLFNSVEVAIGTAIFLSSATLLISPIYFIILFVLVFLLFFILIFLFLCNIYKNILNFNVIIFILYLLKYFNW